MNTPQITKLVNGEGNWSEGTACVMSLAVLKDRIRKGKPIGEVTDELECVCPVLRQLVIRRNDGPWESEDARTAWGIPLADRLLDSRRDAKETARRGFRCADVAVRGMAARALDRAGLKSEADKLRALAPIVDKATARIAESAAYAADAAAHAAYATNAAAYAAASATTAAYAAYAATAAYATNAAADAATHAAYATNAAAAYAATDAADAADAAAHAAYAAASATNAAKGSWADIEALIEEFLTTK